MSNPRGPNIRNVNPAFQERLDEAPEIPIEVRTAAVGNNSLAISMRRAWCISRAFEGLAFLVEMGVVCISKTEAREVVTIMSDLSFFAGVPQEITAKVAQFSGTEEELEKFFAQELSKLTPEQRAGIKKI